MPRKLMNGIDLQSQRAQNAADPSAATDLATKQYVDNKVDGLSYKDAVRAASTANAALSTGFENGDIIDGVTLATGNRILIKNQTTQSENGIYIVNATGAPTRATDANETADLNNATVYVTEGTTLGGTEWTQTTQNPTVGTSNLVWSQKGAGGATYTAGNGLTESPANTFNVGAGSGISVTADAVAVDSTVARVFSTGTHASSTSIAVTHSLGKQFVCAHVFVTSTGEEIFPDVTATSTTVTTFAFGSAPSANTLTFVIHA